MLDLSPNRKNDTLNKLIVRHDHYQKALTELERLLKISENEGGRIIPVLGPTRCGKSELASDLVSRLQKSADGPRSIVVPTDFVFGRLPTRPSERDYYGACLRGMNFDYADRERPAQIRDRLFRIVREYGIRTIVLDEVNHCAETLTRHSRRQAADHFKTIVDETSVNLVLTGLPMFSSVVESNEQFAARCLKTLHLNPYWWSIEEERVGFCDAVYSVFDCLIAAGVELDFDQEDMARRLYGVSGGRIPVVLEVLRAPMAQSTPVLQLSFDRVAQAVEDNGLESMIPADFFQDQPPCDTDLIRSYVKVMADAGVSVEPKTAHEMAIHHGI